MADSVRPSELRYTETHEWVRLEGDVATVGITDFAVEHLKDLTFLQLPETGQELAAGDPFGEIESVKAVADLNSPVSGEVVEVNDPLADDLETLKNAPFQGGWMMKVRLSDPSEVDRLLTAGQYEEQVRKEQAEE